MSTSVYRQGKLGRVPDAVAYPTEQKQVEIIVSAAHEHNVCIIPFGGGTSVSSALECPPDEKRMILSVDMHKMNRIKWFNKDDMTIRVEAGAVGKELEAELARQGITLGHEPDSYEFSTVGGWISTRASGMKKNVYGNIEDLLVQVTVVTPTGVVEKNCAVPRLSTGPDVHQMILGSEGLFGIITEAVLKVRPLPEARVYGSIVFPDFESGFACLREVAFKRCWPASIRLMDNPQFQLGQALKAEPLGGLSTAAALVGAFTSWLKKTYITKYHGFDVNNLCAATLLFEGTAAEVKAQEAQIYAIAHKYRGVPGGPENGVKGYFLTYMIAYLRDFGFNYHFIAESFETSVPWHSVLNLCNSVKERIKASCQEKGIVHPPLVSCRITQLYDAGAVVYFYFGFVANKGGDDAINKFSEIEEEARDEILAHGGSLSHHHGVGKLRKRWMAQVQSPAALQMVKALKKAVDPKNIFCAGNLIDTDQ